MSFFVLSNISEIVLNDIKDRESTFDNSSVVFYVGPTFELGSDDYIDAVDFSNLSKITDKIYFPKSYLEMCMESIILISKTDFPSEFTYGNFTDNLEELYYPLEEKFKKLLLILIFVDSSLFNVKKYKSSKVIKHTKFRKTLEQCTNITDVKEMLSTIIYFYEKFFEDSAINKVTEKGYQIYHDNYVFQQNCDIGSIVDFRLFKNRVNIVGPLYENYNFANLEVIHNIPTINVSSHTLSNYKALMLELRDRFFTVEPTTLIVGDSLGLDTVSCYKKEDEDENSYIVYLGVSDCKNKINSDTSCDTGSYCYAVINETIKFSGCLTCGIIYNDISIDDIELKCLERKEEIYLSSLKLKDNCIVYKKNGSKTEVRYKKSSSYKEVDWSSYKVSDIPEDDTEEIEFYTHGDRSIKKVKNIFSVMRNCKIILDFSSYFESDHKESYQYAEQQEEEEEQEEHEFERKEFENSDDSDASDDN